MTAAPPTAARANLLAVVLAGGLGRRMATPEPTVQKGLVALAGRPMVAHVLDRLAPQIDRIALNVNSADPAWHSFGLPLIADAEADFLGPLAGVHAGLAYAARQADAPSMVVFVPTDTPFLPTDLVARLTSDPRRVAVAEGPGGLEPAVAAVPTACLADLTDHLARLRAGVGNGSLRGWLLRQTPRIVAFGRDGDTRDPFTNVNTPEERAEAERRLTSRSSS